VRFRRPPAVIWLRRVRIVVIDLAAPVRGWRKWFSPALLRTFGFLALATLFAQWMDYRGFDSGLERALKDWLLQESGRRPVSVALVEIDNKAYEACFRPPENLTPSTVTAMLDKLATSAPRSVVGVDLLTDSKDYQTEAAIHDRWFTRSLPPIVLAAGQSPRTYPISFGGWFFGARDAFYVSPTDLLGKPFADVRRHTTWGIPIYPTDQDGTLRRLVSRVEFANEGIPQDTFAATIAKTYFEQYHGPSREDYEARQRSGASDEVFMAFGEWPELRRFSAIDLFSCDKVSLQGSASDGQSRGRVEVSWRVGALNQDISGTWGHYVTQHEELIVLFGATYEAAADRHYTPRGEMSGLELNAYAVRSEIAGGEVVDLDPIYMFFIEWLGACAIAFAVSRLPETRQHHTRLWIAIGGVATFLALAFLMHSSKVAWPGLVSVVLTMDKNFLDPIRAWLLARLKVSSD